MEKQPRNNKLFSNSRRNVTEKKEVRKRVFSVFLRRTHKKARTAAEEGGRPGERGEK